MRKLLRFPPINALLRLFFSMFYQKKYLKGKFFQEKVMGWQWAWRGLRARKENKKVPWPVHPRTIVNGAQNIIFPQDSINVFQAPGCYWQAFDATITIGHNCFIAPNVGMISTNHDLYDPRKHAPGKPVVLGDNCWIGMNAVILPGVELGENTVVAAGAVVTKSFPEGHCVVGGVPAKLIKKLPCAGTGEQSK